MTDIFCSEYFVLTGFAPIHNDLDNKMIGFWHPLPPPPPPVWTMHWVCAHYGISIALMCMSGYEKYLARRRRCASLESAMDSPRHRIRCYDSCLLGIMHLPRNSRCFGLELITGQIVFVAHCVCELSTTIMKLTLTKSLTPECLRTLLAGQCFVHLNRL